MFLKLDSILIDEEFYPRNEVGWRHIQSLIEALRSKGDLEPIVGGRSRQ